MCGVHKLSEPKFKLPLLITGNGRSGTQWFSRVLAKVGVDCPHEHCGTHGTVSWYFFTDSDWHPYNKSYGRDRIVHTGERRSDFEFLHTVHLTRDPLKTIGSLCSVMSLTNHKYVSENSNGVYPEEIYLLRRPLLRAMHMAYTVWTAVDRIAERRVKIENVGSEWPALMKMVGMDPEIPMPVLAPMHKSSGIYKAFVITYADMEHHDALLTHKIAKLAARFGYT